jgi:hypothetical protein
MACPALPLCGLAVTEAERRMPSEFVVENSSVATFLINQSDMSDYALDTAVSFFSSHSSLLCDRLCREYESVNE